MATSSLVCVLWTCSSVMTLLPRTGHASYASSDESNSQELQDKPISLGLFDLHIKGEVSDPDRERLTESLKEGVAVSGDPPLSIGSENDAMFCRTLVCRQKVAKLHKVDFLVQANVEVKGRDYLIGIQAIDGRTGDVVAERNTKCDICGVTEAANMLKDGASQLREKLNQLDQVAELRVATDPSGARVYVDGSFRGVSPLLLHLAPGEHEVEVSHDGYSSAKRSFSLVGGVRERQAFALEPQVSVSQRKRKWAIGSLVSGSVFLAGGATMLAMHGMPDRRDCSSEAGTLDSLGNCRYVLDLRWFGFGATAVGAALAGWGATVLWGMPSATPRKNAAVSKPKHQRAGVGLGFGRRSAVLYGRF